MASSLAGVLPRETASVWMRVAPMVERPGAVPVNSCREILTHHGRNISLACRHVHACMQMVFRGSVPLTQSVFPFLLTQAQLDDDHERSLHSPY